MLQDLHQTESWQRKYLVQPECFSTENLKIFFHLNESRTNFAALHLREVWFFFLWWHFWYLNSLAEFQHELVQVSHSGPLILSAKNFIACRVLPLFSASRSDLKPGAFLTSSSTTFFAGSLRSVAHGITSRAVIDSTAFWGRIQGAPGCSDSFQVSQAVLQVLLCPCVQSELRYYRGSSSIQSEPERALVCSQRKLL